MLIYNNDTANVLVRQPKIHKRIFVQRRENNGPPLHHLFLEIFVFSLCLFLFHSILMHGVASEGEFFFQTIQLLQCTLAARCTIPTATIHFIVGTSWSYFNLFDFRKVHSHFLVESSAAIVNRWFDIYSGCCKFGLFFISFSTRSNVSMPKQNTC